MRWTTITTTPRRQQEVCVCVCVFVIRVMTSKPVVLVLDSRHKRNKGVWLWIKDEVRMGSELWVSFRTLGHRKDIQLAKTCATCPQRLSSRTSEGRKPRRNRITQVHLDKASKSELEVVVVVALEAWASQLYHHHHNRLTAPFPGQPWWASARRELLDFMVQGKINRGRHTDHPAGCHSMRTNQCPPPPSRHHVAALHIDIFTAWCICTVQ